MSIPFEDRIIRIEKILESLEGKEISLEESVLIYKEALEHIESCQTILQNAKNEIVSTISSEEIENKE